MKKHKEKRTQQREENRLKSNYLKEFIFKKPQKVTEESRTAVREKLLAMIGRSL